RAERLLEGDRLARAERGITGIPARVAAEDRERDARPRIGRRERRVRAERDRRAGVEQAAPRVTRRLRTSAPVATRARGVLAEVDRLDRGGDTERPDPRPIWGMAQLHVLQAWHEGRAASRRPEDVQREPDRGIA